MYTEVIEYSCKERDLCRECKALQLELEWKLVLRANKIIIENHIQYWNLIFETHSETLMAVSI